MSASSWKRMAVLAVTLAMVTSVAAAIGPAMATVGTGSAAAQEAPVSTWTTGYGDEGQDKFKGVARTDDGYVLAGRTTSGGSAGEQGWLVKIDEEGETEWEQSYGGPGDDTFSSVIPVGNGFLAVGWRGTGDGADGWAMMVNQRGETQWEKSFDASEWDGFWSVVEADDGFVLVGKSKAGPGSWSGWALKVDANGNEQWSQTYGGSRADQFKSAAATDDGFVFVGSSDSNGDSVDGWALEVNADGEPQWSNNYGSAGAFDGFWSVAASDDGYVLAGQAGSGSGDAWAMRIDERGQAVEQKTFGGERMDRFYSVIRDGDDYVFAGMVNAKMIRDADEEEETDGENTDGIAVKTDRNLGVTWERTYGGGMWDRMWAVTTTDDGGYLFGGDSTTYGIENSLDGWVAKADGEGNVDE